MRPKWITHAKLLTSCICILRHLFSAHSVESSPFVLGLQETLTNTNNYFHWVCVGNCLCQQRNTLSSSSEIFSGITFHHSPISQNIFLNKASLWTWNSQFQANWTYDSKKSLCSHHFSRDYVSRLRCQTFT